MTFKSFETLIIPCESAEDIFQHLQFGSSILAGASYGDIGFRGQFDATWPLEPTAFRSSSTLGYLRNSIPGRQTDINLQVPAEILSIREFAERADRVGLPVPGPFHEFRSATRWGETDPLTINNWPKLEYQEILAMAQHHGVPTRLLDFSYDPHTAGFFATWKSFLRRKSGKTSRQNPNRMSSKSFAIWVVDLRVIQMAWNQRTGPYRRRFLPRVREVRVPRASNEFLHVQHGFFLLDLGANDLIAHGRYEELDVVIRRFSADWSRRDHRFRVRRKLGRRRMNLLPSPVIKLVANWAVAGDLLKMLNRKGISLASLMPDYAHVVSGLELERKLSTRKLINYTKSV